MKEEEKKKLQKLEERDAEEYLAEDQDWISTEHIKEKLGFDPKESLSLEDEMEIDKISKKVFQELTGVDVDDVDTDEHTFDEQLRSPKGGVTIKGTFYPGGEFIPKTVNYEEAKKAIEAKKKENESHEEQTNKESSEMKKLYEMMNDEDVSIRAEVARRIDQEGLHKMINDKSEYIREEIARRINQEGLHKMINDKSEYIRAEVAERINQEGLHKMIDDKSDIVREEIARRINQEGLHKMINDKSEYIRAKVAQRIDQEGLHKMINDKSEYIRAKVAQRINQERLHKMIDDESDIVREEIARRINQEGLRKLVDDKDYYVRLEVARRIDQEGLHKMINDKSEYIRAKVAERINQEGLHKMIDDKNSSVAFYARQRLEIIHEFSSFFEKLKTLKAESPLPDLPSGIVDKINKTKNEATGEFEDNGQLKEIFDEVFRTLNDNYFLHDMIRQGWLDSSNNNKSSVLRDSVKRIFGGEIYKHDNIKDFDKEVREHYRLNGVDKEEVDNYVKYLYKVSQKILDVMFPDTDEIEVYRGTTNDEVRELGQNKFIGKQNNLSSWTLKKSVAKRFANKKEGIVLKMKVNKKDILTNFFVYSYEGRENEMLVISKDKNIIEVVK